MADFERINRLYVKQYGATSPDGACSTVTSYQMNESTELTGIAASSSAVKNATRTTPSASAPSEGSGFKIKPFRRMIRDLEKHLSHDDVIEMAQLTDQSPDSLIKIVEIGKPFHYLIANLEKQGLVSEGNVDTLVQLLAEIDADEPLQIVYDYRMSSGTDTTAAAAKAPLTSPTDDHVSSKLVPQEDYHQHESPLKPREPRPTDAYRHYAGMKNRTSQHHRNVNSSRKDIVPALQSLSIDVSGEKELTIIDSMRLGSVNLCEENLSQENVVMAFLSRLMSYDYRCLRLFKELQDSMISTRECRLEVDKSSRQLDSKRKLSCRDLTHAIIIFCDPFLRQDVLSKMSACQLAVPIIIPATNLTGVTFLLWGLQKISKAWQDPRTAVVHEQSVSNYPFPVVTALKIGDPGCSKSNILNKLLGSIQGNDDHPYFVSREQEANDSILSPGTLEAVWYLPSGSKRGRHAFNEAMCFLNLRGDAGSHDQQLEFICKYTMVIILFINEGEVRKNWNQISAWAEKSKLITVMCSSGNSVRRLNEGSSIESLQELGASVIDSDGYSTVDICEYLCQQINATSSQPGNLAKSLKDMLPFCEEGNINVDLCAPECAQARESAESIIQKCRERPKDYKSNALPLQLQWQKWSQLDKDRSWKGAQGNIERELAKLHQAKADQRRRQRDIGMSKEMRMLYGNLLHPSATYRHYLVFWLHQGLNEVSFAHLRPLAEDLKTTRDCLREYGAEITSLQRKLNSPTVSKAERRSIEGRIAECKTKETELQRTLAEKTSVFDSSSLGFEHFVREFGQVYECFHNAQRKQQAQQFDTSRLPKLAAEMLLSGYPLEIFDGDTCHVPIKWVRGVLAAVRSLIGDVSVYVISVIGIQSSGKSTLLNSMFGVRFAVSAGRCTRGVFLQLLPIADNLKRELGCEYVAVIDTEGLKAPEKAIADRKSEDNELATFALCLSDMTLINIGGQTVGEDLSNILQISAHAFIRMKEVHLRSSCYLIQQFVADITAQYRNQTSTQSILQKLDQAVLTAAREEKKEDQYRQFSDCFNIVNIDTTKKTVQYIPSLWRGAMSSPNHDYSETVLKLKSALLREIKESDQLHKVSEFEERIASVWEAVKQEDFVFNFRNTNEIAQYSNFSQMYKRQQLNLIQEMMKWELNAKQRIKNTSVENVHERQQTLVQELEEKLTSELDKIKASVEETLMRREFESVRQHSIFFYRDLDLVEHNTRDSIKHMIRMESAIITNAETKETQLLPQLKGNLRRQVLPVAERLKEELLNDCSDPTNEGIVARNEEVVRESFETEWSRHMSTVQLEYPVSTPVEIAEAQRKEITRCVTETLRNTNVSKEMKELMSTRNVFEQCKYSPTVNSPLEIPAAYEAIGDCTEDISVIIDDFAKAVDASLQVEKFKFSTKFLNGLSEYFQAVVTAPCSGCRDKTMLLLCLSCYVIQRAHDTYRNSLLDMMMKNRKHLQALKMDDISTTWAIKNDVRECLKDSTTESLSSGILTMLKHFAEDRVLAKFISTVANSDENFQNEIRRRLQEISSRRRTKKWYSSQVTKDVIIMANRVLDRRHVFDPQRRKRLLGEACTIYIHAAIQSEKETLSETLSWDTVQTTLKTESVDILDQMKQFTEALHHVLPPSVTALLLNLSREMIRIYSRTSVYRGIRHTLDECLISELPVLSIEHSNKVLSIVRNVRQLFLGYIQDSGTSNPNLFRSVLNTLHQELEKPRNLGKIEHVVCFAHFCSWALPICVQLQATFDKESSVQSLLEREKALLYEDFKALCEGRCSDHVAAKSFCAIIDEALRANVKNRICTALFDRLTKAQDEIFCSRPRFLQAVLIDICKQEKFENYTGFLCNHSAFIQKWALEFIANHCCETGANDINIEDIVLHEVDEIIREAEESLEATLRAVEDTEAEIPFDMWIQSFRGHFEKSLKATLNEESVSEMSMYAVVSDYSIFIEECKVILNDSMRQSLITSVEIPDASSESSIKEWIAGLPKKLHEVLAQSVKGCGTQCPFCKTLCDDTIKEHKVHFSNLHYPNGVGGWRDRRSQILVHDTCVANVASDRQYFSCYCGGYSCSHSPKPYRNYKQDYPHWDIRPIANYEATLYWKWVLTRFNDEFARYYNCKRASIPWGTVTKEQALSSIREMV